MRKFKNILFDLDGTLTDPRLGIENCIKYALKKLNKEISNDYSWCIGPPLQDSFYKILGDKEEADKAVELYRERYKEKGMYENNLYEGICNQLTNLTQANKKLFVATSKPHYFAKKVIEHFGLQHFFVKVHGAELDGTRRDKGELIKHILIEEGLESEETLMIGDTVFDLIGAKKNNIYAAAVLWGYGDENEIRKESPEYIFDNPSDLIQL